MVRVIRTSITLASLVLVIASSHSVAAQGAGLVHVAPPTGVMQTDRASIVAALERAQPRDTIQFAPGTYVVGEIVRVDTPRLTFLGHAEGTTLRGCAPDEYETLEREFVRLMAAGDTIRGYGVLDRCGMFALIGGHATVRGLTIEYSRLGLVLGCCEEEGTFRDTGGGYRIERNTFRNSGNSIRGLVSSVEPTLIQDNIFINTFHAVSAGGSRIHVLRNEISVPEPSSIPAMGHPGFAIAIGARPAPGADAGAPPAGHCDDNIIAGNRIDGHTDGILLLARGPEVACRRNEIRENTITVRRVGFQPPHILAGVWPLADTTDPSFVGVPISLSGQSGAGDRAATVENTLIENNQIEGAEGVGIEIVRASRNRIVNNTITGITRRDRYPGNTVGTSPRWPDGNGSAIWVSPGSNENEIRNNTFASIAAHAVVLEGDRNRVVLSSASDSVRDLGRDNAVHVEGDRAARVERLSGRVRDRPTGPRGSRRRSSGGRHPRRRTGARRRD